jgi:hypothetical protein
MAELPADESIQLTGERLVDIEFDMIDLTGLPPEAYGEDAVSPRPALPERPEPTPNVPTGDSV